MIRILCRAGAAAGLCALAGLALAHGDSEKPLFVDVDGTDSGTCDDPAAPCRSISYALSRAGKGAQIRVAAGNYPIENPEDLFHVASGVIEVNGGFAASDQFTSAGRGVSVLTGVPAEFRDLLKEKGFQVVSDRKAIDKNKSAAALELMQLHEALQVSAASAPCTNGSVAGLACMDVDLLSHVAFADVSRTPSGSNDVWGFVDLNTGREYAIIGFNTGTGFFDISDPENPLEVGYIDGQRATWRDIKVLQKYDASAARWHAYAYITTDGSSDGLFVVDMGGLPHFVQKAPYVSDFLSAHNVYLTNADFATGVTVGENVPHLIIAGPNLGAGQYRAYSLANPLVPTFVNDSQSPDYMHDAASMTIRDARKDTQCVNATDTCTVLFDFNETSVDIWDLSQPDNPVSLSRTPYANVGYTHSGWPSEDGEFLFVHDELDEQNFGLPTTLRVFSLADLRAPSQVGAWSGLTTAIDHNGFVRGNRYYMSNYSRGLTILDLTDPADPVAVGRLDTYPFADSGSFAGAWGAYPFFLSGTIAISDIESGLYLASDRTRDVAAGKIEFTESTAAAVEGQAAQLTLQRSVGSEGQVSVAYEVIPATAGDSDIIAGNGIVAWNAGDAANKTINIDTVNDGVAEDMEMLLVRLLDPEGGATLGNSNYASLYVSDPGATADLRFFASNVTTPERGFATAVLTLHRDGTADGAASVDYSMSAGDAAPGTDFIGQTDGTISWPDGDADPKNLQFTIVDDGLSEPTEFFELSLSNAVGAVVSGPATARVSIEDGTGIDHTPNAITGVSQTAAAGAAVTLDGSQSNDPDGDALTYAWSQTMGPTVSLSAADSAAPSFTAPTVTSDTLLQFSLTVSDPSGLSDSALASITVLGNGASTGSGASGGGASGLLGALLLAIAYFRRRIVR